MAKTAYHATTAEGDMVTGVLRGDEVTVREYLRSEGLMPIRIRRHRGILQFEITPKRVGRKDLMHFSRQLAVFLRSGIPVLEALEVMTDGLADKTLKSAALDIAATLRSGENVATAASAHPEVFPPVYVGILYSAELTGHLDAVLDQLADYLERDLEARRRISSALVYPVAVFALSVVTIGVLGFFVLPRLADFFRSFDAKLPLTTRMVLGLANFTKQWGAIVAIAVAVAVLLLMSISRTEFGRRRRDELLLHLPVIGDLVLHAAVERFCRVLSSMIDAGVPLPDALAVTTEASGNVVFRARLEAAREQMLRGEGLAAPLSATGLFPVAAQQMFRVGENTGTLREQLKQAADYFDGELAYKIGRFTAMFEPAVIVFMGGMVGFVAIALISAMYGIFNKV